MKALALVVVALTAFTCAGAAMAAAPQLVIDGGTAVTMGAATRLVVPGDVLAAGALVPGAGSTVVVTGYGAPTLAGVPVLAGLAVALHGTAAIAQSLTLSEALTLSSGWLSLGGHDLVAPVVVGGSASSYVVTPDTLGRLVRPVDGATNVFFPVGNSHYDPASLRASAGGDLYRVAVLDKVPQSGLTPNTALERAWAITQANPGSTGIAHAALQWNANEQDPQFDRSLGNPTSALAFRWLGGTWVAQPGVRLTDNGLDPAVDSLSLPAPGLWTLADPAGTTAVPPTEPSGVPVTLQLALPAPHPVRSAGMVRYALPHEANVTLTLYDLTGARRAVLASGVAGAGWHVAKLDASRVPAGVYFLQLAAEHDVRTMRCVVLR